MSEMRRLQTFLDYVRLGTVAAVAEHTQYSTSAVSHHLDRLAADLGVALFEPRGRVLQLTSAGAELVVRAQGILDEWEETCTRLREMPSSLAGTVAVAAFQTACLAYYGRLSAHLGRDAPDLRLTLSQAERGRALHRLLAREIDVAIIERYRGESIPHLADLAQVTLAEDAMLLAVPPHWDDVTSVADLAGRPWVLEEHDSPARVWADAVCTRSGFSPSVVHETSDVVVQCELASSSAAAFIPALTPLRVRGAVRLVPIREERTVLAVTRRTLASPSRTAVVETLRAMTRSRSEGDEETSCPGGGRC